MTGCPASALSELTKRKTLYPDDVSGNVETFNGCVKRDGKFV